MQLTPNHHTVIYGAAEWLFFKTRTNNSQIKACFAAHIITFIFAEYSFCKVFLHDSLMPHLFSSGMFTLFTCAIFKQAFKTLQNFNQVLIEGMTAAENMYCVFFDIKKYWKSSQQKNDVALTCMLWM